MLEVHQLTASYDGSRILRGVHLRVAPGEVLCLMGRNGVGKTTSLKAIMGLIPSQGSVRVDGVDVSRWKPEDRARQGLGYVPQGRDVFPGLTVGENLRIGAAAQGRALNGEMDRVLSLFPVLKTMLGRKGGVLSGGQQQQLAIARALLTNPKVLLLDEPTEGIQPNIIDQIGATIRKIRSEGLEPDYTEQIGAAIKTVRNERRVGILLVEQYLDFCMEVGDRFSVMDRGDVVAEGAMADLSETIVRKHLTV